MYDAIIIGAGPTGCSAAKKLADNGHRVLLVERWKLPRNKSCSGILIKKSRDLVRSYFDAEIPQSVMCKPYDNRGMVFTNDNGREYRFEQLGRNIWRSSFDHWLAEQAVKAGAELRDETAALSCEERDGYVTVTLKGKTEYREQAKIVIACDGAAGMIKQKLTAAPKDYIVTYQTFHHGATELDPHYFYAYLQPELSEYDAWFNVKDDYLILGVAARDASRIEKYHPTFVRYMEAQHNTRVGSPVKSEKWLMPQIHPGCPIDYGKGRVLFAGEAAGFLNPMGEGISAGLECGHAVAAAISGAGLNAHDTHALYAAYKSNTSALKEYMARQWRFVGSVSERFADMKFVSQGAEGI